MRSENDEVRPVSDLRAVSDHPNLFRNTVEQDVITRGLLERVTNCRDFRAPARATLQ